jgi:hypothetical protein
MRAKGGLQVTRYSSLPTAFLLGLLAMLISMNTGCSFSNSSGSISDSVTSSSESSQSSSESSSDSSKSGDDDDKQEEPESELDAETYAKDVTQLAYTYAKQGGDIGSLRSSVSGLAVKRGLTNWEVDPLTSQSIGKGVEQAGMSEEAFTTFSKSLFGNDLTKSNELQKGYQAGQSK